MVLASLLLSLSPPFPSLSFICLLQPSSSRLSSVFVHSPLSSPPPPFFFLLLLLFFSPSPPPPPPSSPMCVEQVGWLVGWLHLYMVTWLVFVCRCSVCFVCFLVKCSTPEHRHPPSNHPTNPRHSLTYTAPSFGHPPPSSAATLLQPCTPLVPCARARVCVCGVRTCGALRWYDFV